MKAFCSVLWFMTAAVVAGCTPATPAVDSSAVAAVCDEIERAAASAADARSQSESAFRDAAHALMFVLRVEGAGQDLEGELRDGLREIGGLPGARDRVLSSGARGAAWCEASNALAPRVAAPAIIALDAGLVSLDSEAGRSLILAARSVGDARFATCSEHVRAFTDLHEERNADAIAAWSEEQSAREAALVSACRAAVPSVP
jgi:hypothetical protein